LKQKCPANSAKEKQKGELNSKGRKPAKEALFYLRSLFFVTPCVYNNSGVDFLDLAQNNP